MKYITLLFAILLTQFSVAQFSPEVSLGYIIPTHDKEGLGYGKAYLSIGDTFGATLIIGGDSRITYGGEQYGRGWTGGAVWMDLLYDNRDLSVKPFLGIESRQKYERVKTHIPSGFVNEKRLIEARVMGLAGVSVGWKFLEFTINTNREIGIGIKINR